MGTTCPPPDSVVSPSGSMMTNCHPGGLPYLDHARRRLDNVLARTSKQVQSYRAGLSGRLDGMPTGMTQMAGLR